MNTVPLFVMAYLIIFCRKMMSNYRLLVHTVDNPVEVKFTEFEKNRDPLSNFDRLKRPAYLSHEVNGMVPFNKHEELFWLSRHDLVYLFIHVPLFI